MKDVSENTFKIIRKYKGRELKITAAYNDETGDWNVLLFDGAHVLDARATTDVLAEVADMLKLELATS